MKAKTEKRKIEHFVERGRACSGHIPLYRVVDGGRPEFLDFQAAWEPSAIYKTRKHLLDSPWDVVAITAKEARIVVVFRVFAHTNLCLK